MKEWRTEQVEELFNTFLQLKNTEEVSNFCRDLLTLPEIEEFARRFQIAKRLAKGDSQRQIAKELGVSITTVTRVNQWLIRGSGGYLKIFEKKLGDKVTEKLGKKVKKSVKGVESSHHHHKPN